MFRKIKDFFVKEEKWGFPWKREATRFSQWYTLVMALIGVWTTAYWLTDLIFEWFEEIGKKIREKRIGRESKDEE